MAKDSNKQGSLEQFIDRHMHVFGIINSFYYTIQNQTLNKLFEKYIFVYKYYNFEEYKQLKLLNLCNSILFSPSSIFNEETQKQLLAICPNDKWKTLIKIELSDYVKFAPIELKQLFRLRHLNFKQLRNSQIYSSFQNEMLNRSMIMKNLLRDIYNENQSYFETSSLQNDDNNKRISTRNRFNKLNLN